MSESTTELVSVSCPICDVVPTTVLYRQPDLLIDRERDALFTLTRCDTCGLVIQNPRPRDLTSYYDNYPVHESQSRPWWVSALSTLWDRPLYQKLYKLLGPEARILEVGCGSGRSSAVLRRCPGWSYTGLEPLPAAVETAQQAGLNVTCGDSLAVSQLAGEFDLIYMHHVLEHLEDPVGTIERIAGKLSAQGYLMIVVPNIASLEHSIFGQCWSGLDQPRHLWMFSTSTLPRLLAKFGFRTTELRHSTRPSGWVESLEFVRRSRGSRHGLPLLLRRLLLITSFPLGLLAAVLHRGGAISVLAQKNRPIE